MLQLLHSNHTELIRSTNDDFYSLVINICSHFDLHTRVQLQTDKAPSNKCKCPDLNNNLFKTPKCRSFDWNFYLCPCGEKIHLKKKEILIPQSTVVWIMLKTLTWYHFDVVFRKQDPDLMYGRNVHKMVLFLQIITVIITILRRFFRSLHSIMFPMKNDILEFSICIEIKWFLLVFIYSLCLIQLKNTLGRKLTLSIMSIHSCEVLKVRLSLL